MRPDGMTETRFSKAGGFGNRIYYADKNKILK